MPSYCRQGVCLAGFEVAILYESENGKQNLLAVLLFNVTVL